MSDLNLDPERYGPTVANLLSAVRLPDLGPGKADLDARESLEAMTIADVFAGRSVVDNEMAACCLAGLWMWFDYLDESHTISQRIPTSSGGFWHGIMHRREPDYSNAKYWFRRVGAHPIFPTLAAATPAVVARQGLSADTFLGSGSAWDPFRFVDLCERACQSSDSLHVACRELALVEWHLLFDYCYESACGK